MDNITTASLRSPSSLGVGCKALTSIEDVKVIEAERRVIYKKKRELLQLVAACHYFQDKALKLTIRNSTVNKEQLHSLMMLSTASLVHSTRYLSYEMLLRLAKGLLSPRSLQNRLYSLRNAGFITIEAQDGGPKRKTVPKFYIIHRSGMNILRIFEDYLMLSKEEYDFDSYL